MNNPRARTSAQTKCRDVAIAAFEVCRIGRNAGLAGPVVAAYPVTLLITSREGDTVNLTKVSEACLLKVVRALGIKALRLLTILPTGFETLLVAMVRSRVGATKHVLAVTIWIVAKGPSITEWPVESRITSNDYHSAPGLRFSRARGNKSNS